MKKILYLFLSLILCTLLIACGTDETSTNSSDVQEVKVEEENWLAQFEGYWERPEDYVSEGMSLVDQFMVDSYNETWAAYNDYGSFEESFPCYADEYSLTLDLSALGSATFYYEDGNLVDEEGTVHFIPGMGPTEDGGTSSDMLTTLIGTWYLGGDPTSEYIVINDTTYESFGSSGTLYNTSTWELMDMNRGIETGEFITQPMITLHEEDGFFDTSLYILDNQVMTNSKNIAMPLFEEFYVHEDAVYDGSISIDLGHLMTTTWLNPDYYNLDGGIYAVRFEDSPEKRLVIQKPNESDTALEEEFFGNWDMLEKGRIHVTYIDGSEENVTYDSQGFLLSNLGVYVSIDGEFHDESEESEDFENTSISDESNDIAGVWNNYNLEETIIFYDDYTFTLSHASYTYDGEYYYDGEYVALYPYDTAILSTEGYIDGDGDLDFPELEGFFFKEDNVEFPLM